MDLFLNLNWYTPYIKKLNTSANKVTQQKMVRRQELSRVCSVDGPLAPGALVSHSRCLSYYPADWGTSGYFT